MSQNPSEGQIARCEAMVSEGELCGNPLPCEAHGAATSRHDAENTAHPAAAIADCSVAPAVPDTGRSETPLVDPALLNLRERRAGAFILRLLAETAEKGCSNYSHNAESCRQTSLAFKHWCSPCCAKEALESAERPPSMPPPSEPRAAPSAAPTETPVQPTCEVCGLARRMSAKRPCPLTLVDDHDARIACRSIGYERLRAENAALAGELESHKSKALMRGRAAHDAQEEVRALREKLAKAEQERDGWKQAHDVMAAGMEAHRARADALEKQLAESRRAHEAARAEAAHLPSNDHPGGPLSRAEQVVLAGIKKSAQETWRILNGIRQVVGSISGSQKIEQYRDDAQRAVDRLIDACKSRKRYLKAAARSAPTPDPSPTKGASSDAE